MLPIRSLPRSFRLPKTITVPRISHHRTLIRLCPASTRSYTSIYAPKQTWSRWVWYKKDGTIRSKIKGALFVTLATVVCLTFYEMLELISDLEHSCFTLEFLFHAQRVDYDFASKDFSEFKIALSYFFALFEPFITVVGEDSLDSAFEKLLENEFEFKNELHELITQTATKIHQALTDGQDKPVIDIAWEVHAVLEETLEKLQQYANALELQKFDRLAARSKRQPDKDKDYTVVG